MEKSSRGYGQPPGLGTWALPQNMPTTEEERCLPFLMARKKPTLSCGCFSRNGKLCSLSVGSCQLPLSRPACQLDNEDFQPWHEGQAKWSCPALQVGLWPRSPSSFTAQGLLDCWARELLSPLSGRENVPGANSPPKPKPLLESPHFYSSELGRERKGS